jgi:hypothetical protein
VAITTLDGVIAAAKQTIVYTKTGALTTVAAVPFDPFAVAGNPGAGTLAGHSATPSQNPGLVPVDTDAGYPPINSFGGGNTGYLAKVSFASSVACRLALYDCLWIGGAYAFNANVNVSSPSWAARVPGGTDFTGLELWAVGVTAGTLVQNVNVSYTNQADAAKSTGAISAGVALTVGKAWQLPLQSGDNSVKTITNVTGSVASAGTFNVMVLRPLWDGRVKIANDGDTHDMLKTGLKQVFDTSALMMLVAADSTALGLPDCTITIING